MSLSKHWSALLDDYAIDLAWSPDGAQFAAASQSGGVTIYDAKTGAVQHTLAGHENGTNCLAWLPVGSELARAPDGANTHQMSHSLGNAALPAILASGGQDGFVRFWDATTGQQTAETKIGTAWVEHLAWKPEGTVPTPANTPSASKWQMSHSLGSAGLPVLFASAGKKLVALKSDGALTHTFPDAPKTITALALSPAATASSRPELVERAQLSTSASPPTLSAAYFGGVCNWNTATFVAEKELPYGNTIHALTWSPDGRWLVAGCQDNAVHLWMPAGDEEFHMSGYETKLKELSFSRDSKWLATGGGRDACVWDCAGAGPEGREPMLLPHSSRVCAVAFQHQHGLLATAAAGGEFSLWSPTRKNPLIAEAKMPSAATKIAWSPDDSLLAVGTEKGAVFVFKVEI